MMDHSGVQRQIREFIERELKRPLGGVTGSGSLLEAGILDSLGVLELVAFIEREYGIGISEDEMMPENFDSIEAIAAFVTRRQGGRD